MVTRKPNGVAYAGVGEKFILTGYRKPMNSTECIYSVFSIHNQTGIAMM